MSDVPLMMTGDVTRRVGLTIPAALLEELGFKPIAKDKRAQLWAQADYPAMCVAIGQWVKDRQKIPMQPKPEAAPKKPKKTPLPSGPSTAKKPAAAAKSYDTDDL